jgi:hypothetical protein
MRRAVVIVAALSGLVPGLLQVCDAATWSEWAQLTKGTEQGFAYFVSCATTRNTLPVPSARKYFMVARNEALPRDKEKIIRYELGIPITEGRLPPQPSQFTLVNDNGAPGTAKVYVIGDAYAPGEILRYPELIGKNAPTPPSSERCAMLVHVPWMRDRNRPFWVFDDVLSLPVTAQSTDGAEARASNNHVVNLKPPKAAFVNSRQQPLRDC